MNPPLKIEYHLSEKVYGDMAFLKRHWLYASVGLVVLLCVSLGTFLAWRANQPVEPKTVYALPKPNPKRARDPQAGVATAKARVHTEGIP